MTVLLLYNLECVVVRRKYDKVNFQLLLDLLGEVGHCIRHNLGNFFFTEPEESGADGRKGD